MEIVTTWQPILLRNISMEEDVNNQSTFMKEVETYMTYKVASYINKYWFPVLVPMGLVFIISCYDKIK